MKSAKISCATASVWVAKAPRTPKILSAEYRSADGQSGTLQTDGGALTLQSDADGKNTYTIALLTEINSGGRTRQLTFTFLLEWQEEQDIRLNLVWMKNSTEAQSIVCEPGDRVSAETSAPS